MLKLILLCVSIAVSGYLAEAVLTFTTPEPEAIEDECRWVESRERCNVARRAGVAFDTRSVSEVIDALARRGVEAWPAIVPKHTAGISVGDASDGIRQLAGISNVMTVYCNAGEHVLYGSDEHGFRNPPGIHGMDVPEIVLIGDSFVQGYCVPSGSDIASRIRRVVPKTLNLGVDDAGPLLELAALREYAEPLRPRVVLWLYFEGNDLADLAWEKRQPIYPLYLKPRFRQRLRELQPAIDLRLEKIATALRTLSDQERHAASASPQTRHRYVLIDRLRAFATLSRLRERIHRLFLERPAFDEEVFRAVLARAKERVASWDGRLYFVYLPSWERFGDPGAANPHREAVLGVTQELGIESLDVGEVFEAQADPTSLFPLGDLHYTASGYALVGDAILAFLEARREPRAGEGR